MEEKNIFNYDELEEKYNIHIEYPGKAKTSLKLRLMSKLCCTYRSLREMTLPYIPMGKREKFYWLLKDRYQGRKIENSVNNQENAYIKLDFIHMYDFIPKERMEVFVKELARF